MVSTEQNISLWFTMGNEIFLQLLFLFLLPPLGSGLHGVSCSFCKWINLYFYQSQRAVSIIEKDAELLPFNIRLRPLAMVVRGRT